MKKLNKIFATAAIAATSMFSAQPACAQDTIDNSALTAEVNAMFDLKFANFYGDEWVVIDDAIKDNPDKNKIVLLGVALHEGMRHGSLTDSIIQQTVDDLVSYGCDATMLYWIMYQD